MSASIYSETEGFLPNLPGFRAREYHSGTKKSYFTLVDGKPFLRREVQVDNSSLNLADDASLTSTSLVSSTSSLNVRPKLRTHIENVNIILAFNTYFEEQVPFASSRGNENRIRKATIYYFTEDGTLSVVEKPQKNSGMPQGKR